MRKEFAEHFPHSSQSISSLWKSATFVFDANTLLNLYRYSDNARDEFLAVLREMKGQICVPDQAAHEYFRNRAKEIISQDKAYNDTKKMIDDLSGYLSRDRGHPFISAAALTKLKGVLDEVCQELDKNQKVLTSRLTDDEIMRELAVIFEDKVSRRFKKEELDELFVEGAKRFEAKIPPGYLDSGKHKDPQTHGEKRSVYGDLIIWFQIIDFAEKSKSAIVFVTDDTKDDWWLEVAGRTIGPRTELVAEFSAATGQNFHMYKPEQFLKYAKDHLKSTVSRETLEEVASNRASRAHSVDRLKDWSEEEINNYRSQVAKRVSQDGESSFLSKYADRPVFSLRDGKIVISSKFSKAFYAPLKVEIEELTQRKRNLMNELVLLEARSAGVDIEKDVEYRDAFSARQARLLAELDLVDSELSHRKEKLNRLDDFDNPFD